MEGATSGGAEVQKSDEFRDFVMSRRTRLLQTAWLLTGDWHLAEDLVQTALLRALPHWPRISDENPDAYVRRALYTVHASWWRRRWRGEVPMAIPPDLPVKSDDYEAVEQRRVMVTALRTLPPRQRAVLVLRYFEDLSERETALALGCTVGTVKSQTAKALAALRAQGVTLPSDVRDEVPHD